MNDQKHFLYLQGTINVVLTEWLPIGHESIKFLQDKLECAGPDREFFITGNIDRERNSSTMKVGSTEVRLQVNDFTPMENIRFTAEVNIESTGANVQEEKIGVCVNRLGGISYGLSLKDRPGSSGYSVDELAYVVADLIEDSSIVMDTIFNSYQKRLLDIIYCNQSSERDKFCIVTAERLSPDVGNVQELFDTPAYRSELRQLLGAISRDRMVQLDEQTVLVAGESGILMIGENGRNYSEMLRLYGLMGCIVALQNNIFSRISWSWDLLYEQKRRVQEEGIEEIMDIQNTICGLSADQGLLMSVPMHLKRAMSKVSACVHEMNNVPTAPPGSDSPLFRHAVDVFNLSRDRIDEASDALETLGREIQNIRSLASTLSDKETFSINRAMNILTVVSVIVLPLTLITGIYGMNFYRKEPSGETLSVWNMPELYWKFGYPATIGTMVLIAATLLFVFWKKGLLLGATRSKK